MPTYGTDHKLIHRKQNTTGAAEQKSRGGFPSEAMLSAVIQIIRTWNRLYKRGIKMDDLKGLMTKDSLTGKSLYDEYSEPYLLDWRYTSDLDYFSIIAALHTLNILEEEVKNKLFAVSYRIEKLMKDLEEANIVKMVRTSSMNKEKWRLASDRYRKQLMTWYQKGRSWVLIGEEV